MDRVFANRLSETELSNVAITQHYKINIHLWIFILIVFHQNMAQLKCRDYGFECDFVANGEIEQVIEDFRIHTDDEHGIDYSKEAIMQFLLRKQGL